MYILTLSSTKWLHTMNDLPAVIDESLIHVSAFSLHLDTTSFYFFMIDSFTGVIALYK